MEKRYERFKEGRNEVSGEARDFNVRLDIPSHFPRKLLASLPHLHGPDGAKKDPDVLIHCRFVTERFPMRRQVGTGAGNPPRAANNGIGDFVLDLDNTSVGVWYL